MAGTNGARSVVGWGPEVSAAVLIGPSASILFIGQGPAETLIWAVGVGAAGIVVASWNSLSAQRYRVQVIPA